MKNREARSLIRKLRVDKQEREKSQKQQLDLKLKRIDEESKANMAQLLKEKEEREQARKFINEEKKRKMLER